MKTKLYLIFMVLILNSTLIFCQNSTNTSSGNILTDNGSVSYSVGEISYMYSTSSTGSISTSIQNPYEITTTLGIEDTSINLKMNTYPNPTVDNLYLSINNYSDTNLKFVLYNLLGAKLETRKIVAPTTLIDMKKLPSTFYFLKVLKNNKPIKTFKIIKN